MGGEGPRHDRAGRTWQRPRARSHRAGPAPVPTVDGQLARRPRPAEWGRRSVAGLVTGDRRPAGELQRRADVVWCGPGDRQRRPCREPPRDRSAERRARVGAVGDGCRGQGPGRCRAWRPRRAGRVTGGSSHGQRCLGARAQRSACNDRLVTRTGCGRCRPTARHLWGRPRGEASDGLGRRRAGSPRRRRRHWPCSRPHPGRATGSGRSDGAVVADAPVQSDPAAPARDRAAGRTG